jgi:hypothetical protein
MIVDYVNIHLKKNLTVVILYSGVAFIAVGPNENLKLWAGLLKKD